jgi:hypothetical protein
VPWQLEADDPAQLVGSVVVARPLASPTDVEILARGLTAFEGPARAGLQLIVVSLDLGDEVVERAWLVEVPDRDPPDDGIYDLPAPSITVSTASGSQLGVLGDGCYVYLCVETGRPVPPGALEPLTSAIGETAELAVGDGSGLVAWEGRLTPLDGSDGEAVSAGGVITETPASTLALSGLEPPGRGEWLLDVEVELDRERGWLRTAYRLVVE